jgi:hypothetical protein
VLLPTWKDTDGWNLTGPRADRHERQPCENERREISVTQRRAGGRRHIGELGAGKQANVELGCLPGLFVELQMRHDLLYGVSDRLKIPGILPQWLWVQTPSFIPLIRRTIDVFPS